jgi:formate hydrogenlyase subunit 3/multisubunit Na+/H+ antiporter MnhD subunit
MFAGSGVLLLTVCPPLLGALLLVVPSVRRRVVTAVPWTAVPAFGLALLAKPTAPVDVPWLLLGAQVGVDETGRVFLLFSSALWLASGQYARHHLARDPRQYGFLAFFLVSMAGNLGVIVAADMVTFYFFFALMSFASYGLVIHAGDPESLRAGRVYLAFVVVGEVLLFVGMVGLAGLGGGAGFSAVRDPLSRSSPGSLPLACVLAGFAVKTAAVPLHMWLPLAYRAAPFPGSAVLSGPMIKAGLLGWLRFLPLGAVTLPTLGTVCLVGGFISAFWGVVVGVTQRDPKAALGYSSISQMGLITAAVGVGLLAPASWPLVLPAICLYAFHHAMAKAALFLGAGIASGYASSATQRRMVMASLVVPALALAGAPLTNGAAAKLALKSGFEGSPISPGMLELLLSVAAVGTTLLMARFLVLAGRRKEPIDDPVPAGALFPWLVTIAGTLSAWVVPWMGFQAAARMSVAPMYVWTATWPALLGIGIAWWVWRKPESIQRVASLHIPPGDMLFLLTGAIDNLRRSSNRLGWRALLARSSASRQEQVAREGVLFHQAAEMEARFQRWDIVGGLVLAIAAVLFVLLSDWRG